MSSKETAYLNLPPESSPSPPVTTNQQTLPYLELEWKDFEILCKRIVKKEADIENVYLYGGQGEKQKGIDIIAYVNNQKNVEYRVYQCRRLKEVSPSDVERAVKEFNENKWQPCPKKFILCFAVPILSSSAHDKYRELKEELFKAGISFEIWCGETFDDRLKSDPFLTYDFFNKAWAEAFHGHDVINKIGPRLAGIEISKLRKSLFSFYQRIFERFDTSALLIKDKRISYQNKYVNSRILEQKTILFTPPTHEKIADKEAAIVAGSTPEQGEPTAPQDEGEIRPNNPSLKQAIETVSQEKVLAWVSKQKRAVILGEPGLGKSTLLRYMALNLLDSDNLSEEFIYSFGELVPIYISFRAWTKEISANQSLGLHDFIRKTLESFDQLELMPLIEQAIKDSKAILLIDGLDEFIDKESQERVLLHLETFLVGKENIPVFMTSRPIGYERKGLHLEEWAHGNLLRFDSDEIKQLAYLYFYQFNLPEKTKEDADYEKIRKLSIAQADEFHSELSRSDSIYNLAEVPLLLILLIQLKMAKGNFPESKVIAYEEMVSLLLSSHPSKREMAAGLSAKQELSFTSMRNLMAYLAFRICRDYGRGSISEQDCEGIFYEYLIDKTMGLAYEEKQASALSKQILSECKQRLGLLVEVGKNELGFSHLTLQEYLAALHIKSLGDEFTINHLKENIFELRWRQINLNLISLYGIKDGNKTKVDEIISLILSNADSEAKKSVAWLFLVEVVFDGLGATPKKAIELTKGIFNIIETVDSPAFGKRLVKMTIRGTKIPYLSDLVYQKIHSWFPARDSYRRAIIIKNLKSWKQDIVLKERLLLAMKDDDDNCRIAAARTLATFYKGNPAVLDELFGFLNETLNINFIESILTALVSGWLEHRKVQSAISSFFKINHSGIRLTCIQGRVKLGKQTESDLEEIYNFSPLGSKLSISRTGELLETLMQGWPKNERVKKYCLEVIKEYGNRTPRDSGLSAELAGTYLLKSFPNDNEVASVFAEIMDPRNRVFTIGILEHSIWENLATNFKNNNLLQSVLNRRLGIYPKGEHYTEEDPFKKFYGPTESHIAIAAGTNEAKRKLLENFDHATDHDFHWFTLALMRGWPNDPEIKQFLLERLYSDNIQASSRIAGFANELIEDKDSLYKILIKILKEPKNPRPEIALDMVFSCCQYEKSEVIALVDEILSNKDRWVYANEAVKRCLIKYLPYEEKTKAIAYELWNEPDVYHDVLVSKYENDPYLRNEILNTIAPINAAIRSEIVYELCKADIDQEKALGVLFNFVHEEDANIRVQGAISAAKQASRDKKNLDKLLDILHAESVALGSEHEARRKSAIAAYLAIGRLDIFIDRVEDKIKKGEPIRIDCFNMYPRKETPALTNIIFEKWHENIAAFGRDKIYNRLQIDTHNFCKTALRWMSQYPFLKKELRDTISSIGIENIDMQLIQSALEVLPKSEQLLDSALKILIDEKNMYYDRVDIARSIGIHFKGNTMALAKINEAINNLEKTKKGFPRHVNHHNLLILCLCYGWPESQELKNQVEEMKKSQRSITWYLYFHLGRLFCSDQKFMERLEIFYKEVKEMDRYTDSELVNAIDLWLKERPQAGMFLEKWIENSDASKSITAISFLAKNSLLGSDTKIKLFRILDKEMSKIYSKNLVVRLKFRLKHLFKNRSRLPAVGYNLLNGKVECLGSRIRCIILDNIE